MPKYLNIYFTLMIRILFWLAGILAFFGLLWRSQAEMLLIRGCLITVLLAVWVEFLILFTSIFFEPKSPVKHYDILFPALLLGFLLPPPLPVLYLVLLGIAETVRRLGTRRFFQKISVSPIPLENRRSLQEKVDEFENDTLITQQILRRQTKEGTDRLEGNYLVEFFNDQSTATIHVPFCPAFDSVPKIEVFRLDNVEIKWNIFEPRNFGVRIDIKKSFCQTNRIRIMVVAESPNRLK
jgi:hypothetical protein